MSKVPGPRIKLPTPNVDRQTPAVNFAKGVKGKKVAKKATKRA